MAKISELLSREEIMEKQHARLDWLKDGDRNTSFFQAKARERARVNRVTSLKKENGEIVTEQEEMEKIREAFYTRLFTAQDVLEPDEILQHVPVKVTNEMNASLSAPFIAKDVQRALFMMGPSKALGPDGFNAGFFQLHWDILGPSITVAVLDFLNGGDMPEELNRTTICLIPKVKNPQEMKQFRLISLCNVLYKICSKIIANRLPPFLDEIISEEQSAFVPGRLITDNVLIAYDCNHYLKRKKEKIGACAIKLDKSL
jgi:hypothetical protein